MPPIKSNELLQNLRKQIVATQYKVENRFGEKSAAILQHAPMPGKWSAIQCLEHLNTYGRYYLPALEKAISTAELQGSKPTAYFHSSWLGAYFTRLMQPKEDGELRSRMKSPKGHLPAIKPDTAAVIGEFIAQQETMETLLLRAEKIDLQAVKVPTSLSRFIRLSIGDTFGFLTAHINRHIQQAEKAIDTCLQQIGNLV
ncbi:DinB family protein [Chitinophaga sp. MM2321]|uniref:DinB family protein n=1 Tax=Chitinophaga sp. MM2321 TaxID=3137178 RepID=UPI0032D578E7